MRNILQRIFNTVSGERAFHLVEEIASFHRIQASTGYRKAANHVKERLENYGVDVKIKTFPADGKTWLLTQKMFKEWDCKEAYLKLNGDDKYLSDFSVNNLSVIQKSFPCDFRNQPLDIVLLDRGSDARNYEGLDLKGKLVFVRDSFSEYMDWAIKEKGAVGFVTDFMRELKDVRTRYDLLDTLNYTSFWWKHTKDEPKTFGFVLTPREGDKLAKLCQEMRHEYETDPTKNAYPKATCYVNSKIYEGEIEIVETYLKGETEEEILIVSHLCHPRPSANDNASGVAASMEAMNILHRLTSCGELKPLKRSIRMIFIPEFTGTYAFLADLGEKTRNIKAGINMDMVGGRQSKGYGPVTISATPHANPFFSINLAALVLDEVKKNVPAQAKDTFASMFNSCISDFEAGSDHFILSDPQVNIPSLMVGQWPDIGYHTGADTTDVVDPFILHKTASICAGFVYLLANLSEDDVPLILIKNRSRFIDELSKLFINAVEENWKPKHLYEEIEHFSRYYQACNQSIASYLGVEDNKSMMDTIQKENIFLNETSAAYWHNFQEKYAPGYVYEAESTPKEYDYVPVRKFSAPIIHLDDHALIDEKKFSDYKLFMKNHRSKLHSGHKFDAVIAYYMDGQRTVWEIAKEAMLETRDGSVEYVHEYVKLLKTFDLVEIKPD